MIDIFERGFKMNELDCDKLTIDNVIKFLEHNSIISSRMGNSANFALHAIIIAWLKELEYRRENEHEESTSIGEAKECALEVEREELHNGGPLMYEEWCRCTNCNYRHALFIPREYCPKCGYKFMSIIYKGSGILYGKDKGGSKWLILKDRI